MKKCSDCQELKNPDEFRKNKNRPDGLSPYCTPCGRLRDKATYARNRERNPGPEKTAIRVETQVQAIARARAFARDYLSTHPCVDCGEDDLVVLEFDHVRDVKVFNISKGAAQGYTNDRLADEISKCEVRCANCHRRITAQRGNWHNTTHL